MPPKKRYLTADSTWAVRTTKRQALCITNHEDSTQSLSNFKDVAAGPPPSSILEPIGEVCYGMICNVATQFLDDPSITAVNPTAVGSTTSYHQFQIVLNRIHMLQTSDGKDISVLNTQASKALSELDRQSLVRYNVYVAADEWTAKLRSFITMGQSIHLDVAIHLFGSPSNSAYVGKILSDTGHFLQPPDFLENFVPYHNPHEISFPSHNGSKASPRISNLGSEMGNDMSVNMISTVLNDLDHRDDLISSDIDACIIMTELKPHQKQALDFIIQREALHTAEPFSLFKIYTNSQNLTYYEHSVTGCRRPEKQPEDFGGIIADEMGLGKTLTMISAIAKTKEKACQFQNKPSGPKSMKKTRATLVICPAVLLMDGWSHEVSKHVVPEFLRCIKYHGTSKAIKAEMFDSDIVMTTYATLIADSARESVLHGIHWFRVIIDEAHSIRHEQTKQFRAVVALSARYRWCLTGTPIQNTLSDLGALVRFLRVPQLNGPSDFHRNIAGPIERGNVEGIQKLRNLLRCICLRRTKDLLNISKPDFRVELVQLSKKERDQYCGIGEKHRRSIDRAIERGNLSEASSGLFRAILRLRIFCNSGLCFDSEQMEANMDESSVMFEQGGQATCTYCACDIQSIGDYQSPNSGILLSCSHILCLGCIGQSEKEIIDHIRCVTCGTICPAPALKEVQLSIRDGSPLVLSGYSSKMEALVKNIVQHKTEKCIVFSAWKKSIKLAITYLGTHNIPVCIVDGDMSLPERRSAILEFQQNPTIPVLLMTLGTGAVGLNLTVANRVHILEPQWNPSIEKQAIGRVVRLGQEKSITVIRYIVENSVEQYIQTKQEKKLYVSKLGWDAEKPESEDEKLQKITHMKSLLSIL